MRSEKTISAPSTLGAAAAAANFSTRGACTSGHPDLIRMFAVLYIMKQATMIANT